MSLEEWKNAKKEFTETLTQYYSPVIPSPNPRFFSSQEKMAEARQKYQLGEKFLQSLSELYLITDYWGGNKQNEQFFSLFLKNAKKAIIDLEQGPNSIRSNEEPTATNQLYAQWLSYKPELEQAEKWTPCMNLFMNTIVSFAAFFWMGTSMLFMMTAGDPLWAAILGTSGVNPFLVLLIASVCLMIAVAVWVVTLENASAHYRFIRGSQITDIGRFISQFPPPPRRENGEVEIPVAEPAVP